MLARIWRKGNPCALLVRMQIGTITLGNSMKIPQDIKNETIIWSRIPLQGIYSEEMKSLSCKDTCTFMLTAALFTIGKTWKQPVCLLMNEWRKKIWEWIKTTQGSPRIVYPFSRGSSQSRNQIGISCVYIYNGILFSYNKERNSAICNNWTLKHYDRWNNSEKDKYYDISYMWNLKTKSLISYLQRTEAGCWKVGEMSEGDQKIPAFSYEVSKFWGYMSSIH